jgi:curved DNA-binding protein CbpA
MNYKPSPHRVLGISPNASKDEVKGAYRTLAKKWHPDKYPGKKEYAEEQFRRIKQAYEEITNTSNKSVPHQSSSSVPFYPHQARHPPASRFPPVQNVFPRMQPQVRPSPNPNNGGASVLCNGTVLLSGGFHPSHLTADMLLRMQQNANSQNCNARGCFR